MSDHAYHQMSDDAPPASNRPQRSNPNSSSIPNNVAPPAGTPGDSKDEAGDENLSLPVAQPVGLSREVKRSPNRLIVDEAHGEGDNSVVMLSLAKMEGQCSDGYNTTAAVSYRHVAAREALCRC
jgi:hypothetical protein